MRGEPGLQFLDTNILVYGHDRSNQTKYERASNLLKTLWVDETGCLSIQVLQEFHVTVTQKIVSPIRPEDASHIISRLGSWRVHSPIVADIQEAISIQDRYGISFWDAMIIRSAEVLGCDVIWSEDLNAGQRYRGMLVSNPFASVIL